MTDARFPERWLNDRRILRLSDGAFRLFVIANAWAVSNRTDGELHNDDLPLMRSVDIGYADELAKVGLWERIADRWLIADYINFQTSKHDLEVLENARRRDREKKARQRARPDSVRESSGTRGQSTGTVPRERPRGQHRTGQDRPGVGEEEVLPTGKFASPCDRCQSMDTQIVGAYRLCREHAGSQWRETA